MIHDDVSDFMTEYMEAVSEPRGKALFNYSDEQQIFEKTFSLLNRTLGSSAFVDVTPLGHHQTQFLLSHYEAFTLGLQSYLSRIDLSDEEIVQKLRELFLSIKKDMDFRLITTLFDGNFPYRNITESRVKVVEQNIEGIFGT